MIQDYYVINTIPATEPITLSEAKEHLRIESTETDNDSYITRLITTARKNGEKSCNRTFINTTWECYFCGLDTSNVESYPFIQIRKAPLSSISSVELNLDSTYTPTTDYIIKNTSAFPRLIFQNGAEYDDTGIIYPIKVTGVFGYSAIADGVPEDIRHAMLANIAYLYENRGDTISEGKIAMPLETKLIYKLHYRILNTFG